MFSNFLVLRLLTYLIYRNCFLECFTINWIYQFSGEKVHYYKSEKLKSRDEIWQTNINFFHVFHFNHGLLTVLSIVMVYLFNHEVLKKDFKHDCNQNRSHKMIFIETKLIIRVFYRFLVKSWKKAIQFLILYHFCFVCKSHL